MSQRFVMLRVFLVLLCCLIATGCTRPDLPHSVIHAASDDEFTASHGELAERFGSAALADYEVALQELQLAAMDRGVATAADRAKAMREAVNGQTVRAAEILGWQARRARLQREIQEFAAMLERDLALREKTAAAGTPQAVIHRIENEQDILAKLRRLLAEAEAKLSAWNMNAPA